jgi:hypothetical protein
MRNTLILAAIAFAVALAIIVGNKLSNEAMAVVVGTVCGIGASIPVSIGLVIASSHNWGKQNAHEEVARGYQPPIVIVNPQPSPMAYGPSSYYLPTPTPNAIESREFKIIGGE